MRDSVGSVIRWTTSCFVFSFLFRVSFHPCHWVNGQHTKRRLILLLGHIEIPEFKSFFLFLLTQHEPTKDAIMSDAPSKQQAAEILTAETIPSYLQEQCWDDLHDKVPALQSLRPTDLPSALTVTPIAGGNVNYAFCLTFATPNHKTTVFLKQAPEFVAIFGPDGFPLTSQRMQREINVYHEWSTLLGTTLAARYLPQIYHFDRTYHTKHTYG